MALYLGSKKYSDVLTQYATTTMDTTDANATAEDILKDKTAYVNGAKVTGTFQTISLHVASSDANLTDSFGNVGDLFLVVEEEA